MKKQVKIAAIAALSCAVLAVGGGFLLTQIQPEQIKQEKQFRPPSEPLAVTLDRITASIEKGETLQLHPSESSVIWSSSDTEVATVGEDGTVTARKKGIAIITASLEEDEKGAACQVIVSEQVEAESIAFSESLVRLEVDGKKQLSWTVFPDQSPLGKIEWKSSDEEVVQVKAGGIVEAKKEGTAVITMAAGELSAVCSVLVTANSGIDSSENAVQVKEENPDREIQNKGNSIHEIQPFILPTKENIEEKKPNFTLTLDRKKVIFEGKDKSGKLLASYTPKDAVKDLIWESSNEKVVTVSDGEITSMGAGSCMVKVYLADHPDVYAECEVIVQLPIEELSFSETLEVMLEGERRKFTPSILPEGASGSLKWSSSDTDILTISETGMVTAHQKGTAVVSVSSGSRTAECEVEVR